MSFRVAVIGGGTGGLCLAQGLHRAGVEVAVYERSPSRTERLQGYRVHINPHGSTALHRCLSPEQWQGFLATTGTTTGVFGFVTEQLERLMEFDPPEVLPAPEVAHHSVSRITLHQVLSSGLDGIVHYGKTFERYERTPEGVRCHFADGSTATADLVVGADGANSRVRRQYLPHAQRVDTGITAIAGKLLLNDTTRAWLPGRLAEGPAMVLPRKDCAMFLAPHELTGGHEVFGHNDETHEVNAALFDNTSSYVMWAYAGGLPPLSDEDGEVLKTLVSRLIAEWSPVLRRAVAESDPDTVSVLPVRTSVPIEPWTTTNITLLGDAVHSMTPFGGIGANTALRDAELLCDNLIAAHRGQRPLPAAVGDYEHRMREYGFEAVRHSLRNAEQFAKGSRLGRTMFRTVLRTAQAVPPLKRLMFSGD